MTTDPFNREFWISLREETAVRGIVGNLLCYIWCNDGLELLVKKGTKWQFKKRVAGKVPALERVGLPAHFWLEADKADKNGSRYIADGTAGQINRDYPLGFYGVLEQAPADLKEVYSNAK